jgi:hypothetical protein
LDVATSDDLDPTHISMLNQDFLRVLFVLEGFKRRADLEERDGLAAEESSLGV